MSAVSPGNRIAAKEDSQLHSAPLDDPDMILALTSLRDVFLTSFGPKGHAKVIHNNCGGPVTLTSSSNRILSSLSTSKPVVKLISSTLQDHLRVHSDGGCSAAILSLDLILKSLDLKIHRRLMIEIYDMLLNVCLDYLQSEDCPVKKNFEFQSSKDMINLIRSFYQSKPACLLFGLDLDYICNLTMEAFAKSIPEVSPNSKNGRKISNNLMYVIQDGKPVQDSNLFPGILYQTPSIPIYSKAPLRNLKFNDEGMVKVALVQTSLAGDSDAFLDVAYELQENLSLSDAVLERLLQFADRLVHHGIGILACQRVVHPRVKRVLKQAGVLVLDRMGREFFSALLKLTGGNILDPFSSMAPPYQSSPLIGALHVVLRDKSYVHLTGATDGHYGNPVHTLVLCHRSQEAAAELEAVCESVIHVLQLMMSQPYVLCGGSCWLTALSIYIQQQKTSMISKWTELLGCSSVHLQTVVDTFVAVLRSPVLATPRDPHTAPVVDVNSRHLFQLVDGCSDSVRCTCGAVTYEHVSKLKFEDFSDCEINESVFCTNGDISKCTVFDSYATALGILKTAVGIGCMVLGIQNFVQDLN